MIGSRDTPSNSLPRPSLMGFRLVFCSLAHYFHRSITQVKPPSRAEPQRSRLLLCQGPLRIGGVVFPFQGGQISNGASRCQMHSKWYCTTREQCWLPTVRAARQQREERTCKPMLLRPPGSFYTFREVGLILSSSPTDCSCCCCCSGPADHVAQCDLGAEELGARSSECHPNAGEQQGQCGQGSLWLQQLGAFAYLPSSHSRYIPLGNSLLL